MRNSCKNFVLLLFACRCKWYNNTMKKLFLLFTLFSCATVLLAQEDSRIFIHPGRETFVYFPSSALGSTNTVAFFLPEKFVPLTKNYPLVVMLGVVPKQAELVAQFQQANPAIVVGINFEEEDYTKRAAQIKQFLTKELLPYVDTNYLTKTGPENRILAVQGASAAKIALDVAQTPNLFGAVALIKPGNVWNTQQKLPAARTLVVGSQEELAWAQRALETGGKSYGSDFALRYADENRVWFSQVDASYLWAPADQVQIKYATADVSKKSISLSSVQAQETALRVWVVLRNNLVFHFVPPALRISPPVLNWQPERGVLKVLSGATPATVRVRSFVDNPAFSVKIKLKK